ncbi:Ethylene-responsive transcription factor ERF018 [Apostasia shenzhenica]|uniref:Ethylene-responsive transcription factor ERF018 n=1 Tax=Apostasia shenzhenica TaxID=1088818 RepID=A0A2H9ZUX0_9ASPA|nr:Ethylene-responsive transcription factor ERF018 [Apostasia shenzhenica]
MSPTKGGGGGGAEGRYKGVRKRKWGAWVSEVRLPNSRERIWLGSYDSPEKAARAFDAASFFLRGRRAGLNFPDRTPDIAIAASGRRAATPRQIQAAAARYAHSVPSPRGKRPAAESVMLRAEEETEPPPPATPVNWSLLEMMAPPDFPAAEEFGYEWHPSTVAEEEVELAECGGPFASSSILWNF